jgi:hypothetical protein
MPGPMVSLSIPSTASDAVCAAGSQPPARGRLRQALTATVTHLHALIPRTEADAGRMAQRHRLPHRGRPRGGRPPPGMGAPVGPARRLRRWSRRSIRPPPEAGDAEHAARARSSAPMRRRARSAATSRSTVSANGSPFPPACRISTANADRRCRGHHLAGQRRRPLREPAAGSPAGIQPARPFPHRRRGPLPLSAPSGRPATACRTTARSARCCCKAGLPLRRPAHLQFLIKAAGLRDARHPPL